MGKTDSGMWHEARKQERKIRVMMVDYKRRADRRRQYYERIKQDPTQFLRVYGRPCKVHWESAVAIAAEGPQTTMPWQGDQSITIDRFDVRSHLDFYQEPKNKTVELTEEQEEEERNANYERYRILVQNEVAGVSEELCLKQIHVDEMYGALENKNAEEEKRKLAEKKAAIAYTYEDSTEPTEATKKMSDVAEKEEEPSDESDIEIDLDNTIDIYNLTLEQADTLNKSAHKYGMKGCDYCDNLEEDKNEAEALKMAKMMEEEKAQFSGRRSRRERRAFKEKRLKDRTSSPPSYAARESPKYEPFKKGRSHSRSPDRSPDRPSQFLFISSFGDEGSEGVVQGPMLPPHLLPQSVRNKVAPLPTRSKRSRSRSGSRERGGRLSSKATKRLGHLKALRDRASRSRSRSRSYSRSRSRSGSRPRSRQRDRSRSRSWSRRRGRYGNSRSRSRSRRRYSRSRSRSRGRTSRSRRSRSFSQSRSRSRGRRSRSHRSRSYTRSRSRSRKSYSSSRSRSSSSRSRSHSQSRSPEKSDIVMKSYRRPSLSSKDSMSGESGSEEDRSSLGQRDKRLDLLKLPGKKDHTPSKGRLTAAEKMKLKMQKALKRQYKADVQARQEKEVKLTQERQDREDELRALSIQMRRRERERRHREQEDDGGSESDERRSRSPPRKSRRSRSRSRRSKSRSPVRRENWRDHQRDGDWGSRDGRYGGGKRDGTERGRSRDRDRMTERDRQTDRDRYRGMERDRDRVIDRDYRSRVSERDYVGRASDRDHGRGDAGERRRGDGWERNEWYGREARHNRRRSESPRDARRPRLVDY